MTKHLREAVRHLKRSGVKKYRIETTGRSHPKIVFSHNNIEHVVIMSCSPSSPVALNNFIKDVEGIISGKERRRGNGRKQGNLRAR